MKKINISTTLKIVIFTFTFALTSLYLYQKIAKAWGFWAHQRINRLAVFTLPPEMIGFYKENIEFITEHAVDPDKRRYALEEEAARHYIDIDRYDTIYPFLNMPRQWDDAVLKFTEDTLKAHGILPWNLEIFMRKLTYAFKERNTARILQLSADVGHYVGDAHVPLHTSHNYNGQLTNQKGIHGFWESRIPELYGDTYDYFVGKAEYVPNIQKKVWEFVLQSANAVDTVLIFERKLNTQFAADKKYCYETRGAAMMQVYCEGYTQNYSQMLDGMVERRMRNAILNIGSFWYTAWVNAGQPNLNDLRYVPDPDFEKEQQELNRMYNNGKIKGREHQD